MCVKNFHLAPSFQSYFITDVLVVASMNGFQVGRETFALGAMSEANVSRPASLTVPVGDCESPTENLFEIYFQIVLDVVP